MSSCQNKTSIYKPIFSQQSNPTLITIIILATIIPFLILCIIFICFYNRHNKKFTIQTETIDHQEQGRRQSNNNEQKLKKQNKSKGKYSDNVMRYESSNRLMKSKQKNQHKQNQNNFNPDIYHSYSRYSLEKAQQKSQHKKSCFHKLVDRIQACIIPITSKTTLKLFTFLAIFLSAISIVFLILSVLASQQALDRQYTRAQCTLNQTIKNFINGTDNWAGISYIIPNITKLQLNLNTRVKATQNSITSLLLNGTNTTFPIGFPNGSRLIDRRTAVTTTSTSVQSFIQASLRQWLFMNSTLSGTYRFPICQTSTVSNIPHPLNDNQTIQLNYISSICANLTQQTNNLVANGQAADRLLTLTTSIQNNKTLISNNLIAHNSSISSIALRSNQYSQQFSSTGFNLIAQRSLPYILLALSICFLVLVISYFIFQYRRFNKYIDQKQGYVQIYRDSNPDNPIKLKNMRVKVTKNIIKIQAENISVSNMSEMEPQQINRAKNQKIRQLLRSGLFANSKFTHFINIFLLLVILVIGLSNISVNFYLLFVKNYCLMFNTFISGGSLNQLTSSQMQLLSPVQSCITDPTPSSTHFLSTGDTQAQIASLEQLFKISSIYNSTTPPNVLTSISLQQIQVLKQYLLHMETMPVKSQDFSIQTLINELNTYSNGSSASSRQKIECNASILRDQFVYNVRDCQYKLINYLTEATTTEARCLQIPTYDGSGGSKEADLNDAQHTIQLNTTCPTVFDFYNGTNNGCFLGKRLTLLQSANCSSTATEYSRRLKNLLKFSVETASYTNAYLQNLRNYFGVYSTLSTNMTQFFNGPNTSAILNQFGTLSNNIINKTSCAFVKSSVNNIYEAFCPSSNSIYSHLYDSFAWIYIAFGVLTGGWVMLLIWQVIAKTYMRHFLEQAKQANENKQVFVLNVPDRFFKNNKISNQDEQKMSKRQKKKMKKLEISEQTLMNENEQDVEQKIKIKQRIVQQNDIVNIPLKAAPKKLNPNIKKEGQKISKDVTKEKADQQQLNERQSEPKLELHEKQKQTQQKQLHFDKQLVNVKNAQKNPPSQRIQTTYLLKNQDNQSKILEQSEENSLFKLQKSRQQLQNFQQEQEISEQQQVPQKLNIFQPTVSLKPIQFSSKAKVNRKKPKIKQVKTHNRVLAISGEGDDSQIQERYQKHPSFFDSYRSEQFKEIKRVNKNEKRQAQSKAEFRELGEKNQLSSVSGVTKKGKESERLKAIHLDEIVKQNLDNVQLKVKRQSPFIVKSQQEA